MEEEGLHLGEEDLEPSTKQGELSLLGRLHHVRNITGEILSNTMKGIWKLRQHPSFRDLGGNLYAIVFDNEVDKLKIMEGRPWLFDRHLLVLQEMQSSVPVREIPFDDEVFWVQVHNLPLAAMTEKVGRLIGNSIGVCVDVDTQKNGIGWGPYLRIRVLISLHKPLPRGKKIDLPDRSVTVGFLYEFLPKFCYKCGRILHDKGGCLIVSSNRLHGDAEQPEYGSWMRAPSFMRRNVGMNSDDFRHKPSMSDDRKGADDENHGIDNLPLIVGIGVENQVQINSNIDSIYVSTSVLGPPGDGVNNSNEVVQVANCTETSGMVIQEMNSMIVLTDEKKRPKSSWKRRARLVNDHNMEIELDSGGVMNNQVDSVGKSGGLMLLWKEEIDITVHSYSLRHIHVTIKEGSGSLPWNITFFYGHPDVSKRKCSWDLLRFLSNTIHNQWLCVGDFNVISNGGEKVGGSDRGGTTMNDFNDALSDSNLVDLGFKGNKYTWSNRRKSPESFIKERLDRSLASLGWLQRWGTYHVEYLTTISSDHSCMYVCWDDRSLRRSALTRRFRYEPNLGAKDACHQLVRQQWVRRIDRGGAQSALSYLQLNLKFCGPKIQKWVVKERQRHAYTEKDLKSKLDSLIAKESHENQEAISAMRHQLQELCELEEKVLLNQSKQHWLKAGDQNTSFFHNSMKRRQNLKGIDKILDEGGCLRTTEPEIAEAFHAYCTSLFSAGSIVEDYSFLDSITRLVDADVNESLCRMLQETKFGMQFEVLVVKKLQAPMDFQRVFIIVIGILWEIVLWML
ncbi:uncharacterized protein LOC119996822 [Tripterygium wilfordii]|uniref:uncharacterized protein LOC119996822 n=1 Tax=Tripterygium wilfordii TaxID=458696 RepID=UPI0018F85F3C|nr:uncharacterized protein LOC119996822 [Tripterygium wilfordii]